MGEFWNMIAIHEEHFLHIPQVTFWSYWQESIAVIKLRA